MFGNFAPTYYLRPIEKFYFMKHFNTLMFPRFLVLLVSVIPFISCKKSNDPPPPPKTITGLWVGTASNGSSTIPSYSLSISPGGKITFEWSASGQEQFGAGTWTLSGSDFTANVTGLYGSNVGVQQTLTAKFNSQSGVLSDGKYKVTSTDTGTFSVSKVE